jgi:hypothetical protein
MCSALSKMPQVIPRGQLSDPTLRRRTGGMDTLALGMLMKMAIVL